MRRLLHALGLAGVGVACGCAGVVQDAAPDRPASYARLWTGDDLRVGAATADITPDDAQYLAGFGFDRVSTGVQEPLAARALVLLLGDAKVAIVGVDNLGLQREDVDWIKSGVYGFENGAVFLCSSHTHAAPDLVGLWGFYFLSSGRDRDYLTKVRRGVMAAVEAAARNAVPADLWFGQALLPETGLVHNTEKKGVFDRRVTVLQARARADGRPVAALLHFGCHPEVMRRAKSVISADFVGPLCRKWTAAGLGQAVFVNGALGAMVTPKPRNEPGLEIMSDGVLAICRRAVEDARPLPVDAIEIRRRDVYMRLTTLGLLMGRLTLAIPRQAYSDQLRTTVGYLRIGAFEAACVPGEMEPVMAAKLRHMAHRSNMAVFGLTDDEIGYLMREVDAHDPGYVYERTMSPRPDAGEQVVRTLVMDGVIPPLRSP